jgi:hypothetical protein
LLLPANSVSDRASSTIHYEEKTMLGLFIAASKLEEGENTDYESPQGGRYTIAKHDKTLWVETRNEEAKKEVEEATKD